MSVVNRMLQDIDRRRTAAGIDVRDVHADIRSVTPVPPRPVRSGRRVWMGVLLICAGVVAAIVWRERRAGELPVAAPATIVASRSPPVVGNSPLPAPPQPAEAAETNSPQPATPTEPAAVAPVAIERPVVDPPPVPSRTALPSAETLKLSLQMSALVAERPVARSRVAGPPVASTGAQVTSTIADVPVRSVAADETVLAARALWNDGARPGALATLRDRKSVV